MIPKEDAQLKEAERETGEAVKGEAAPAVAPVASGAAVDASGEGSGAEEEGVAEDRTGDRAGASAPVDASGASGAEEGEGSKIDLEVEDMLKNIKHVYAIDIDNVMRLQIAVAFANTSCTTSYKILDIAKNSTLVSSKITAVFALSKVVIVQAYIAFESTNLLYDTVSTEKLLIIAVQALTMAGKTLFETYTLTIEVADLYNPKTNLDEILEVLQYYTSSELSFKSGELAVLHAIHRLPSIKENIIYTPALYNENTPMLLYLVVHLKYLYRVPQLDAHINVDTVTKLIKDAVKEVPPEDIQYASFTQPSVQTPTSLELAIQEAATHPLASPELKQHIMTLIYHIIYIEAAKKQIKSLLQPIGKKTQRLSKGKRLGENPLRKTIKSH